MKYSSQLALCRIGASRAPYTSIRHAKRARGCLTSGGPRGSLSRVTRPKIQRVLTAGTLFALIAGVAYANRAGDDRTRAETALGALARSPEHARLAHEAIESAKNALRRADDARAAGDHTHAPALEALGREWAETGSDLVRAAEAEKKLRSVQRALAETET